MALLLLSMVLSACSNGRKPDCSSQPRYDIVVTAAVGPLPHDLKLRLEYDAGCEIYDLALGHSVPCDAGGEVGVMFCSTDAPDASAGDASSSDAGSADAGSFSRLSCTLWGVGAGTVTPQTAEYPPDPIELGRDAVGCDPTSISLVLAHLDAGM